MPCQMKKRKNQNKCYWLFVCYLFLFNIPTAAEGLDTTPKLQNTFTLEVTDKLITLKADNASLWDILRELENKARIKIEILPGAEDKRVTLSISELPLNSVHSLLEKIEIENFAVVYDQQLASKVIYILPTGKNISEIIIDKTKTILFSTHIINVDVARLVAEEYLPKYYPGDWIYFHHLVLYDLNGQPAAYAHIFRRSDSKITNLQELQTSMSQASVGIERITEQISQVSSEGVTRNEHRRLKALLNGENEKLYKWKSFATLITGTTETSSLELSHHKGLPPFFVQKIDLQKHLDTDYQNKNLKLGKIIFFDPFDIRYEVQINSETIYLMDSRKKKLEKISTIRDIIAQAKLRDTRRRDLMTPKERVRYDQGIKNRNKTNITNWEKYRAEFNTQ